MEYMRVPGNDRSSGYCSDNSCNCGWPGAPIKNGRGYLFIDEYLSVKLVCLRSALRRGLNLAVASADAKRWWEQGIAPMRPTPKWWRIF